MEDREIQKEVEKTLNSLDGMKRAEAPAFLYDRVLAHLEKEEARVVSISPRMIWQAAACLAVLIALNVFVCLLSSGNAGNRQAERVNPVGQEYFSYLNNNLF
ncbi:MAG TPA: hypothetical protein VNY73_09815 [Bacteroidia bacterium]|jgi:hypothetical protein|nr:hypothetical protein [Bacteroidia bacterium]